MVLRGRGEVLRVILGKWLRNQGVSRKPRMLMPI